MVIDRRRVLRGIAALGLTPLATIARSEEAPAYIAARMEKDQRYAVAVFDSRGTILFTEELDGRAHDTAVSPDRQTAVIFARRPGIFALVLDLAGRRRVTTFGPPEGRHFYGHGFFSRDGRLLYATENDYDNERGVLGIYDASAGFIRIGEFDTHGIGPHQATLMQDGTTIAISNGGVATHPDYERMKLNIPTMKPSLAYLDANTGDLIEKVSLHPSLHQLSIRHMSVTRDGTVWFGGQYEGPASDPVPLVGTHKQGGDPTLVDATPSDYAAMDQYIGSVAVSGDGQRVAVTSPRGGQILVFDATTKNVVGRRAIPDVCGVAPDGSDFLASDGRGRLWEGGTLLSDNPKIAWDNHIRRI